MLSPLIPFPTGRCSQSLQLCRRGEGRGLEDKRMTKKNWVSIKRRFSDFGAQTARPVPSMWFQCPPDSAPVPGEGDTAQQALKATGFWEKAHQQCLTKSFLFFSPFLCLVMEDGPKCSTLGCEKCLHKTFKCGLLVYAGVKVNFNPVTSSSDWTHYLNVPEESLSFLHMTTFSLLLGLLGGFFRSVEYLYFTAIDYTPWPSQPW